MVDITQCEACGQVIPATVHGCAYCDDQRPAEIHEPPFLPLSLRLLLAFFGVNLVLSATLAILTLEKADGHVGSTLLACLRLALSLAALAAILKPRPWGRRLPLAYVLGELLVAILVSFSWVPQEMWRGGLLPSVWGVLFFFLFLRPDVQARFDLRVQDRADVLDLIRPVERGTRK